MKTIFSLLFVVVLFAGNVFSQANQTVRFTYDASGNRTQRFIEVKEVKQTAGDTAEFLLPEFKPTDEVELLSEVTVYPNPVKQNLHLDITRLGDATATAHLCDISGRPVLSFGNLTAANTLNVESLASGTYLLRVECKGERRVWKIVVSE
ncbi:MAG: T9SS type A sorting domain-containing protein [Bacteroidales bacterium]|nr:T9SS type A sorting domain-containing protein [Bacteroidales bacterium]MDD3666163.1 T9SS type A sorting domain-containing protein [Bacteroidales bacterium]